MVSPPSRYGSSLASRDIGRYPTLPHNQLNHRGKALVAASITDTKSVPSSFQSAPEYAAEHLPGAQQLGSRGSTGTVYQVHVNPATRPALQKFAKRLKNRVTNKSLHTIRDGTVIVIKIMPADPKVTGYWDPARNMNRFIAKQTAAAVAKFRTQPERDQHHALMKHAGYLQRDIWMRFVRLHAEEAVHHHFLSTQPPLKLRCDADRRAYVFVHPSDVAQEFYFAGSDAKSGVYISVSKKVEGSPLTRVPVNAMIAASLQRAAMILHAFGVSHGDMHEENVLVTRDTTVRFIDFGMTVILPQRVRESAEKAVRQAFETTRAGKEWPSATANAVLHGSDSANRYLNSALRLRGYVKYFNPDGKLVQVAMRGIPAADLHAARRRVWSMSAECKKILG